MSVIQGEDVGSVVGRRRVVNCFYVICSNTCGPVFVEPSIGYSGSGAILRGFCSCTLVRILGAELAGESWREPEKMVPQILKRHFLRK